MHRLECVLRGDPDPNDTPFFEKVMSAVDSLELLGLFFDLEVEEETPDGTQLVWDERDELGGLTLFKDRQTGLCTLTVVTSRHADLRKIVDLLGESLDFVRYPELLDRARNNLVMEPEVLVKLALSVGVTPDQDVIDVVLEALEHRLPQVRYYGAYAAAITLWPMFVPELERLLKLEPDQDVAEMAERAINGIRKQERNHTARR